MFPVSDSKIKKIVWEQSGRYISFCSEECLSAGVGKKQNLVLESHMLCDPTFPSTASPIFLIFHIGWKKHLNKRKDLLTTQQQSVLFVFCVGILLFERSSQDIVSTVWKTLWRVWGFLLGNLEPWPAFFSL